MQQPCGQQKVEWLEKLQQEIDKGDLEDQRQTDLLNQKGLVLDILPGFKAGDRSGFETQCQDAATRVNQLRLSE